MMKKKSPILAAVLSFFFGPLGYLYIGWRYAVLALFVFIAFVIVLSVTNFPIPTWMKYVILAVLAWKGFTIVSVRNALIDSQDEHVSALNTFPVAAMAMSDLLVGFGIFYAGAIGLYATAILILKGSVLKGLLLLFLGTPFLVWIASVAFGFLAMGIDAIFASKMENIFRS
jgi:hypothetical protein